MLNHERYTEEVAAGLHDKKGKKTPANPASTPKRGREPNPTSSTVAGPRATYNSPGSTASTGATGSESTNSLSSLTLNLFDDQLTLGEVE